MPITNPLDALRRLSVGPYRPEVDSSLQDPSVQRYHLGNQLAGDTEDQIINQTKARGYAAASSRPEEAAGYQGNIDAFKQLLGRTNQDLLETGIPQGIDEADDYHKREREAVLGGFTGGQNPQGEGMNPIQQAGAYGRAAELEKIQAPLHAAQATAAGGVQQQQIQSQGLRDVANSKAAQIEASTQAAISASQAGLPLSSFNPSTGAFGIRNPNAGGNINPLLTDLTNRRYRLELSKKNSGTMDTLGRFFGQPPSYGPEEEAYKQAVDNVVMRLPGGPDIKSYAEALAQDPKLKDLPQDQLFALLDQHNTETGDEPLDENTKSVLSNLLYAMRGK